ncbi:MAG: HAD-IA family hydrolase [Proteobacteria bacterium]|nr:HAD-IA family hydrolase [Pseudomonadota bacterium]
MKIDVATTVFVFDLDDTLYKEADYHLSGVRAVLRKIERLYKKDISSRVTQWIDDGATDLWGEICEELNLPESVKQSLLWEYRLHQPEITLDPAIKCMLDWLVQRSAGLAILTDGRAITQRLKLAALGLDNLPAYISEEHGSEKPSPNRFRAIQYLHPERQHVYIGDNPAKDFLAANELGWISIGLRGDERNVHSQEVLGLDPRCLPKIWINSLSELHNLFQ